MCTLAMYTRISLTNLAKYENPHPSIIRLQMAKRAESKRRVAWILRCNYHKVTKHAGRCMSERSWGFYRSLTRMSTGHDKTCGGDIWGNKEQELGYDEKVRSLEVVALALIVSLPRRNCTLDSDLLNNPGGFYVKGHFLARAVDVVVRLPRLL